MTIGRLGTFDLKPGYYLYVGGAYGSGGLRARIGDHLEPAQPRRWHIDYLLTVAMPREVWFSTESPKREQRWSAMLRRWSSLRTPIPRFGSSEYRRSRTTHLFYSKSRPLFEDFKQRMEQEHNEPLGLERFGF